MRITLGELRERYPNQTVYCDGSTGYCVGGALVQEMLYGTNVFYRFPTVGKLELALKAYGVETGAAEAAAKIVILNAACKFDDAWRELGAAMDGAGKRNKS